MITFEEKYSQNKIHFTKIEFEDLMNFRQVKNRYCVQNLMFNKPGAMSFYGNYIQTCLNNNINKLESHMMATPSCEIAVLAIDYMQLFYEIPAVRSFNSSRDIQFSKLLSPYL